MNNDKRTTRELAIDFIPNNNRPDNFKVTSINKGEYLGDTYSWSSNAKGWFKVSEQTIKEEPKEGDILEGITGIKWHIDGLTVRDDRNEFVAECMSKNGNIKEDYANARLISKAPELAKENTSLKARIDALLEMEKSDAKFLDLCIKLKARIVLLEDALKLIATTGQPDKDGYISINKATFNLAKEALNQK